MWHKISSAAMFALCSTASMAITAGQVDTFTDGTVAGWGGGASPTNIASGGPAGAADRFLQMTSTGGFGAGGHMAFYNQLQWTGDYVAAGVKTVECDLKNFGPNAVQLRIVVWESFTKYTSANTVNIPANSGWTHATFGLKAADLMLVSGSDDYATALSGCTQLMLRHDPLGSSSGTAIATVLGVDNIKAIGGSTTVSGTVTLGDTTITSGSRSVTFEYRTPNTTTVVETKTGTIDLATGSFSIPAPATPGSYDLAVKTGSWLRNKALINTSGGSVTGVSISLTNGDIDQDNSITVFDYGVLSDYFDLSSDNANWNTVGGNGFAPSDADLDGDGSVTVFDYGILSDHFDLNGVD